MNLIEDARKQVEAAREEVQALNRELDKMSSVLGEMPQDNDRRGLSRQVSEAEKHGEKAFNALTDALTDLG
ncbi:hypothetical protein ABTZ93_05070 [Streptomyces sp. NPDC097941]|uniref:hypothetical protein n=1 Tax=Streptomyces sp. NPDC097941 TaxID=3155685 RepID=UPI0033240359